MPVVVVIAAAFVAGAVFLDMPMALRVLGIVFFGGGGLMLAVISSLRRVAVRVDAAGIAVRHPLAIRMRTVAWPDALAVVYWAQQVSIQPQNYVAVLPRPEAEAALGRLSGRLAKTSVPLNLIPFDRAAFEASIGSFARIPIVTWPTNVTGPANAVVRAALFRQYGDGWPGVMPVQPYRIDH